MNAKSAGSKSTKALQKSSNKGMYITVGVLVAVAVLLLGGIIWWAKKDSGTSTVNFGSTADPQVELTDKGVIALGKKDATTIQVWEDFMCPACGSFEKAYGQEIEKAVEDGALRVEFHMMNFLDRSSKSGSFSTRAIAAMQCVAANESLATTFAVKNAFFANQPQEGGGDRSADELAATAESAGGSKSIDCIKKVESGDAMDKAKDTAKNSLESVRAVNPKVSTPTVAYKGEQVSFGEQDWLKKILAG